MVFSPSEPWEAFPCPALEHSPWKKLEQSSRYTGIKRGRGGTDFSSHYSLICTSSAPSLFLINNAFISLHCFSLIRNPELITGTANSPFSQHFCPGHHQITQMPLTPKHLTSDSLNLQKALAFLLSVFLELKWQKLLSHLQGTGWRLPELGRSSGRGLTGHWSLLGTVWDFGFSVHRRSAAQ